MSYLGDVGVVVTRVSLIRPSSTCAALKTKDSLAGHAVLCLIAAPSDSSGASRQIGPRCQCDRGGLVSSSRLTPGNVAIGECHRCPNWLRRMGQAGSVRPRTGRRRTHSDLDIAANFPPRWPSIPLRSDQRRTGECADSVPRARSLSGDDERQRATADPRNSSFYLALSLHNSS
jgi:hypothetical protein